MVGSVDWLVVWLAGWSSGAVHALFRHAAHSHSSYLPAFARARPACVLAASGGCSHFPGVVQASHAQTISSEPAGAVAETGSFQAENAYARAVRRQRQKAQEAAARAGGNSNDNNNNNAKRAR